MSDESFKGIPLNVLPAGSNAPPPPWITGFIETPVGRVSQAAAIWDDLDRKGEIKARISDRYRMN